MCTFGEGAEVVNQSWLQDGRTSQNAVTYKQKAAQKRQYSGAGKYLNLAPVGSGLAELPATWNAIEACKFAHVAHQVTLLLCKCCIKGCHNKGCPVLKNLQEESEEDGIQ